MSMVNVRVSTPKKNTDGPVRPNRPEPPPIERIQMMSPTAVRKAPVAPTAGQGLGFTRW